jgi:hypothetical protein
MKSKGLASTSLTLALFALACALAFAPLTSARRAGVEGERVGPYATREGRLRIFDEVWEQVREIARQLLLLLRALLDLVVERLGAEGGRAPGPRRPRGGPDLQDIPIA